MEPDRRDREMNQYNAYQLVSQLAFTGVTIDHAVAALEHRNGDIQGAASYILSAYERGVSFS